MSNLLKKNSLYFVPLGGSEEFGANLNVFVADDEFLAVDCGIGFADERFPGIDLLLPDPTFVEENKEKLKGLIVTHAHEDHIGAVAYLWNRLECPVYVTEFTGEVLRRKMEEAGLDDVPVNVVRPMEEVQIGSFRVQFLPVSHSVPQSSALMIRTKHGNILHSGDWNLDPAPVIDRPTDETVFRALGQENILAYIGDSTNAQVEGRSGSESCVAKGLAAEFMECKGRIAVTIFASNIGRIISITEAARAAGRRVGIVGRSLHRMIGAAHECGYLKNLPDFISEEEVSRLPDNRVVMIVTGSQGEPRAALAKIARNDHRSVALKPKDTVIFSSRAIPGNEKNINVVKNNLSAAGVRIVTPHDTSNIIHVSGHPCRGEIADMLQWVRPACVVPVHGEHVQLMAHAALAKVCQVPHTVVPNNGSVIRIVPGPVEIVGEVETSLLALDQKRILPSNHQSITARRKLQYTGAVHVSLVLDRDYRLLGKPKLDVVGLNIGPDGDIQDRELIEEMTACLPEEGDTADWNEDEIAEEVRIGLRRYIERKLGIKPKATVHVTLVDV